MKTSIYILLLIAFGCNHNVRKTFSNDETSDVKVVLLAGQSNMAGAANYDALPVDLKKRIEIIAQRVFLSINGKEPKPLSSEYSEYQMNKRGFGNVFGPEMFLGLTLAERYPNQKFLFIKRTQGGTALHGAWNPEWSAEKAASVEKESFKRELQLYKEHHEQINEQLKALQDKGKSFEIIGMCWMQGENDAAKEVAARNYQTNLEKLISGYRTEYKSSELPFIMGQINSSYGRFPEGPEMVRMAMVNIADTDKYTFVVKTSMDKSWMDFPKHEDNVHYNHVGQMRLGTAFGNRLIEMIHEFPGRK